MTLFDDLSKIVDKRKSDRFMSKHARTFLSFLLLGLFFALPAAAYGVSIQAPQVKPPTAQEETKTSVLKSEEMGGKQKKEPEYVLAYPGILLDHPLFALKRLRDGILERLIVDPIRKAEFYLLQSDKRLAMLAALSNQRKFVVAQRAASEEAVYMRKAMASVQTAKTAGKDIPGYVIDRLERAMKKHRELISAFVNKAEEPLKATMMKTQEEIMKLQQDVEKLK